MHQLPPGSHLSDISHGTRRYQHHLPRLDPAPPLCNQHLQHSHGHGCQQAPQWYIPYFQTLPDWHFITFWSVCCIIYPCRWWYADRQGPLEFAPGNSFNHRPKLFGRDTVSDSVIHRLRHTFFVSFIIHGSTTKLTQLSLISNTPF